MSLSVKVGILSDTHGEVDERIVDIISDCDFAIHAGDICGAHIIESLKPRIDVIAVAGNNDHPAIWHADEAEVVSALGRVQETIRREINPIVYPLEEFRSKLAGNHHFLKTVLKDSKFFLIGGEHELEKLVK